MIQNYKIVTLCGSTRFKDQFLETQKRLTLEGFIVISVGLFGHSGDEEVWKPGTRKCLMTCTFARLIWLMRYSLSMLVAILARVQGVRSHTLKRQERKSDIWKRYERFYC